MSLDQTLQGILSLDPRLTSQALSWAPGWHVPLRKCLWDSMNPQSSRSSSFNAMLNLCMEQVEGAIDAGSSGEQAYRLLMSELRRELDTRACGAALQKSIVFRVGEGLPFSDFLFSFFLFFHLTYSRWTSSLPSCLWSQRVFPSLPGSRLTIFLSRCKFSTLTTRQPMVEFYLLTFPRFPLRKKEHKSYFGKNRTHDFRTSRCAAYLLDHSGDERSAIIVSGMLCMMRQVTISLRQTSTSYNR